MQEQSQIPNYCSHNSTLKLQHTLRSYIIKGMDRSILENKVNVLKQQSQTIRKKAKIIQNQISKINEIKKEYKMEKNNINQLISIQRQKMKERILKEKQRRQFSKENIQDIKQLSQRKTNWQKINEFNITQLFKRSLYEKKQKSLEARLKQEQSRLNQTIFMEKKRLKVQQKNQSDIIPLEFGMLIHQRQIDQMRELEQQMLKKLEVNRQSLTKTKLTLKTALH